MRRWLRRGLVGALLLCVAGFLVVFIRLDDAALHRQVIAQLEQVTGRTVHGGKTRLSLQHGVSLKIAKLAFDARDGDWNLSSDAVRFDIELGSLLFGELHISAIDMIHPVLHLDKAISPATLLTSPFIGKILQDSPMISFRQGQILLHGKLLVDELAATIRRNDREQQTSWEVQSRYAGGDFSSQGYIRTVNAGGDRIFGRITATQLQLAQIEGLPLPALHYDVLDASLTFSLDSTGQWQWFGNLLTRDTHAQLPGLSWRGKVIGSAMNDFRLHDAFVRFGDNTRLVLLGGCEPGQRCQLGIDTRGVNAGPVLRALGVDVPLSGKMDGRLDLAQQEQGWQLDGKLALSGMTWAATRLPDSLIELVGMHINAPQDFSVEHADMRPVNGKGSLEFNHVKRQADSLHMDVRLDGLDGAWVPIGDILLLRSGLAGTGEKSPQLDGKGVLSGSLQWASSDKGAKLDFSLAASGASIAVGDDFVKPAGLAADIKGRYRRQADKGWLEIDRLQLGESRVSRMKLRLSAGHPELSLAAALNLDALKASGVVLPGAMRGWQGRIDGSLEHVDLAHIDPAHVAPGSDSSLRHALAAADGTLHLSGFGYDGQVASGDVRLRDGRLQARKMNWQHSEAFADFDADVNLSSLRGKVNVSRAAFAWAPEQSLPDWLMQADLRGRFGQTDMQWNGNVWRDMQGGFVAGKGRLALGHVLGHLADGAVRSSSLDIEAIPGGVRFSGRLGMTAVHLDKLEGLADVAGAKLDGYLFLNARISGTLPGAAMQAKDGGWRGDGDIEIHHGRWKEARAAHLIQWRNEAAAKLDDQGMAGFSRLSTRFRIRDASLHLSRLRFDKGELSAAGDAMIGATGDISGRLTVRKGDASQQTALGGRWPSFAGLFSVTGTDR